MKNTHIAMAAVLLLALVPTEAPGRSDPSQPKPTVVETVRATPAPPLTLEQAFAEASAVLLVQIRGKQPVPYARLSQLVQTDYVCKVQRVLKGDDTLLQQTVVVRRPGGTREEPNRILRVVVFGFPDFAEDELYVLFLQQYPGESWFAASAEGSFELRGDQVVPVGISPFAKSESNQLASDFLRKLHQLRGGIE
jgi:hypothetical protein